MNQKVNKMYKFKAAWWLKNRHLQTLYPVVFSARKKIILKRERIQLDDGDFLSLDWSQNYDPKRPIILFLHGLEGSSQSPYIQRMMKIAMNKNYNAVCLNFRGCDGETNVKLKSYHAGEIGDLNSVVKKLISEVTAEQKIYLVGFSLGANVLLKWLAESELSGFIAKAIAVSVPFELAGSADALGKGFSRAYEWWLLKCLKQSLERKKSIFLQHNFTYNEKNIKSFWEFDNLITAKINGFKDVFDYYEKSSSRQFIKKIKVNTLIVHAKDDPFLMQENIPKVNEINDSVKLEITKNGGHLGFVEGFIPFFPKYWIDNRIYEFIEQ
ncbi:hydrolase [Pigmentibacter sp. JX0631]|uniref:hydrolase n=1 Tax=Pigmentibacter sp. JX0631 TaxID=2976982 RepID=UPI0024690010|nr:hydrolase [Pigmentibacter sp. JX0631]WGL58764.1 hydrolase [Pigmentibacter sp. JX0631]